jgi:hypothetical protein
MQEEGKKNPELFFHHLHIDLDAPIVTDAGTYPPGSIFCNSISASSFFGKCLFACVPGFINTDRSSFNGCEAANTTIGGGYPFTYGGYLIGDYQVEKYLAFLQGLQAANNVPITFPKGLDYMPLKISLLYTSATQFSNFLGAQPLIWY